ncbi:MAG TPA: response regulator transcription factor [Clostridia bacterium]|jgi:two-component system response regulator protein BraR/BceR|nr:response regulator transcription factor [Clostridiaceae bacterium]HOF27461.1 response regulator transcription factor [Clostridia bacterium]HOM35258.1 response regulator transcription factor [Clostridia bacterium]HOT71245.1 response regulator transcription factor [Clostridia bacterium]HPL09012.1 response regulator transcription factor [Clostridia bacterium]
MYKILIVEDDLVIASSLKKHIETWGYEAQIVSDFKNVFDCFMDFKPHLVLLDISLPYFNGYHWCEKIRKVSKAPILFLSSFSDNMNIIMAMNMGADDFIAKPFDIDVLTAKINALLRRAYDFKPDDDFIAVNGLLLNTNNLTVEYEGIKSELTKNEFRILQVLMSNSGKAVSRDMLMTKLWETDSYIDDNTLTVNINRLRRKLESMGLVDVIKTKKGVGYLIS